MNGQANRRTFGGIPARAAAGLMDAAIQPGVREAVAGSLWRQGGGACGVHREIKGEEVR